jgi:hypothetical protein
MERRTDSKAEFELLVTICRPLTPPPTTVPWATTQRVSGQRMATSSSCWASSTR